MVTHAASGRRMVWWLGSPVALLAIGWLAGLRLNLTGSMPVGLYVTSRSAPVRGALVLTCLPAKVAEFAKARGYVPPGVQCPGGVSAVGKPVVAIAGDTVTVTPAGILVDGAAVRNTRALALDRKGRRLPQLPAGRYVVELGKIWILS